VDLKKHMRKICEAFRSVTAEHTSSLYGAYNDLRLTGKHETASIHDFSYGVSDGDVLFASL
jgi:glutamine synthetase